MTRGDLPLEVIGAVAAAAEQVVDPGKVEPLYDSIDPRILDALEGQTTDTEWRFRLRFAGHRVTVTHDSEILVDGEAYRSEQSA